MQSLLDVGGVRGDDDNAAAVGTRQDRTAVAGSGDANVPWADEAGVLARHVSDGRKRRAAVSTTIEVD